MSQKTTEEMEIEIIKATIKAALDAGYALRVDSSGWAGPHSRDADVILKQMRACDEETLWLYTVIGTEPATYQKIGFVCFVYGNDGHDVINDHTVNLEVLLQPVSALADALAAMDDVNYPGHPMHY